MQNNANNSGFLPEEQWLDTLAGHISSASVVLRLPDDKILLVKSPYKKYWSCAGGVVEALETPLDAAVRETKEEIGLDLDPEKLSFQTVFVYPKIFNGQVKHIIFQFLFETKITKSDLEHIKLQEEEIDTYDIFDLEQIRINQDDKFSYAISDWSKKVTGYHECVE